MHKNLSDILSMPAGEFLEWRAYFEIYPFTFERADWMHAEVMAAILNDGLASRAQAAGKRSFTSIPPSKFYPDYLEKQQAAPVDPKQRAEYAAFKAKLKAMQNES